jgi:hypothetical protein
VDYSIRFFYYYDMSFVNKKPIKPLIIDGCDVDNWVLVRHTWRGLVYVNEDWYEYYEFEATFQVGLKEITVYCDVSHQWTEYHNEGGYLQPDDHGISTEYVEVYAVEMYDELGDEYKCSDDLMEKLSNRLLEDVIYS